MPKTAEVVPAELKIDQAPSTNGVSGFITRDMLLGAKSRPFRTVDVEIDGFGIARIRGLKNSERESLDNASLVKDPKSGTETSDYRLYKARAVAMALIDPSTDKAMFARPLDEAPLLGELPALVLDQLFYAVDELSALTRRTQAALGKELKLITNTSS